MKVRYTIPLALALVGWAVCPARGEDHGARPDLNVSTPRANVQVRGGEGAIDRANANVNVETRRAEVGVQPGNAALQNDRTFRDNSAVTAPIATPTYGVANVGLFTDNRPDEWRYRHENNRWWYYGPDNRWMWYSQPGGWTYYEPSGGYTTGYGGTTVAPTIEYQTVPSTNYYYPYNNGYYNNGYYYNGYRGNYYGRPGVYLGGRGWGVRVGGGRRW